MAEYNGHKNRNYYLVSLWINSDEGLYLTALNCVRRYPKARNSAARRMLIELNAEGITHTPEGAPYSVSAIRAAMRGM